MRALVTGGTGFVGSHLVRALSAAGHTPRVLHRRSSKLDALEGATYESALGDILDETALAVACAGCDWVFHVAAVADYWRTDKAKLMEANVEGTRRVLAAARAAGVKRVVFTSSAAAIGFASAEMPSDENTPFNMSPDAFPYAYSKVLAEAVAQEAVRNGQDVVIVNPVVVIGPGDLNMISGSYIKQVKQMGALIPVTPGGICVVDVRDVARMHIAAAERGQTGERYILATANYTHREWYGIIADAVGVRRPFLPMPGWILPLVGAAIDGLRRLGVQTPIDGTQARLGGQFIYFNPAKGWAALGQPQVDMRQSVRETYQWYLEKGYL